MQKLVPLHCVGLLVLGHAYIAQLSQLDSRFFFIFCPDMNRDSVTPIMQQLNVFSCLTIFIQITHQKATTDGKKKNPF